MMTAKTPAEMPAKTLAGKRILLIISGGIAAYKCLDLIRRLRERGASVTPGFDTRRAAICNPVVGGCIGGREGLYGPV